MSIITISDAAKSHISTICDGNERIFLISVNSKGCSGQSYQYDLVSADKISKMDEMIRWPGGCVAISAKSIMHVIGSTLDLVSDGMQQHLIWHNPQAVSVCGCGESFSVT